MAVELAGAVVAIAAGLLRSFAAALISCEAGRPMLTTDNRLHALDAVRAFALLLGVVFHAGFSFIPGLIPGLWAATDSSPSAPIGVALFAAHMFRMSLFFFVAGFFARMLFQRGGARGFWSNRLRRILLPLVAGWLIVFPLTAAVWIWGLTRTFGDALALEATKMPAPPPGAFPVGAPLVPLLPARALRMVLTARAAVVRTRSTRLAQAGG